MKRPILTGRDHGRDLWGWCHCGPLQGFENSCHSLDRKRQASMKLASQLICNLKFKELIVQRVCSHSLLITQGHNLHWSSGEENHDVNQLDLSVNLWCEQNKQRSTKPQSTAHLWKLLSCFWKSVIIVYILIHISYWDLTLQLLHSTEPGLFILRKKGGKMMKREGIKTNETCREIQLSGMTTITKPWSRVSHSHSTMPDSEFCITWLWKQLLPPMATC